LQPLFTVSLDALLSNESSIHEGDTFTWMFEAGEIHTVTFLATDPAALVWPPFAIACPLFI